jgi:hypothetical protein|tara:strand:+ start:1665 stop:2876 length:1212 start_codon:yes stop_codon:yes gene_type:complete
MSKNYYRKSNSESTRDLYEKKTIYNLNSKTKVHDRVITDFTFAEKALYGRVNRLYLPIVADGNEVPFKNIKSSKNPARPPKALNFVADAFDALNKQFLKKAQVQDISSSQKYLSDMLAGSAYVSPVQLYNKHVNSFISAFKKIIKERKIKFANFEEFINRLLPFIIETTKKNPFTFSAFVKSKKCPIVASGLAINIAPDLPTADDVSKFKHFYDSVNWEFYINACKSYGFMIDRNHPNILVADIASAEMLKFAEPYGILTTDQVLNSAYVPVYRDTLEQFKIILYRMYNELKSRRFHKQTEVSPLQTKNVIVTPIQYSYDQFLSEHSDEYFIKTYCKVRFSEEESQFTEGEIFRLIDNTVELCSLNVNNGIRSFELILNKTFDYQGSLSYYKNKVETLAHTRN